MATGPLIPATLRPRLCSSRVHIEHIRRLRCATPAVSSHNSDAAKIQHASSAPPQEEWRRGTYRPSRGPQAPTEISLLRALEEELYIEGAKARAILQKYEAFLADSAAAAPARSPGPAAAPGRASTPGAASSSASAVPPGTQDRPVPLQAACSTAPAAGRASTSGRESASIARRPSKLRLRHHRQGRTRRTPNPLLAAHSNLFHPGGALRSRRLSRDEETELTALVQQGEAILRASRNLGDSLGRAATSVDVSRHLGLPEHEIAERVECAKVARHVIIRCNMGLVYSLATPMVGRGLELPDLLNEGILGLHEGVLRYDPTQRVQLGTYAYFWVRAFIMKAVYSEGAVICIPKTAQEHVIKLRRAVVAHQAAHGPRTYPTVAALVAATGLTPKGVARCQRLIQHHELSLQDVVSSGRGAAGRAGGATRDDAEEAWLQLADADDGGDEAVAVRAALCHAIEEVLDSQSAEVLRLTYGLGPGPAVTSTRTAQMLGVSMTKVSNLKRAARERLRQALGQDELGLMLAAAG